MKLNNSFKKSLKEYNETRVEFLNLIYMDLKSKFFQSQSDDPGERILMAEENIYILE